LIKNELRKLGNLSQNQLLTPKTKLSNSRHIKNKNTHKPNKPKLGYKLLPFIIPYSEHFPKLKNIIIKHWHVIENDDLLKIIFLNKLFISYKRNKNLKDILIKTKYS